MGICASCMSRERDVPMKFEGKQSTLVIEYQSLVDLTPTREEKIKKQGMHSTEITERKEDEKNEEKNNEIIKNISNEAKQTKKSKKKIKTSRKQKSNIQRRKLFKKQQKSIYKKKIDWSEDDIKVYEGISKKYGEDEKILLQHFRSKKKVLKLKFEAFTTAKFNEKFSKTAFKNDYIKTNGNWEALSKKYEISVVLLKKYYYGYVFQNTLNSANKFSNAFIVPSNMKIEDIEQNTNNFYFDIKEKSPELSTSRKSIRNEPSVSDFNEENNLVEEKISYLSARKEILESLNQYISEDVGSEPDEKNV